VTLADLLASPLPPSDELQALALLFDSALAQRLVNVQAWHGDPRCTAFPVATSDSRWLHTADILLACLSPDGMYRTLTHRGLTRSKWCRSRMWRLPTHSRRS
jgi:hypothetical protein